MKNKYYLYRLLLVIPTVYLAIVGLFQILIIIATALDSTEVLENGAALVIFIAQWPIVSLISEIFPNQVGITHLSKEIIFTESAIIAIFCFLLLLIIWLPYFYFKNSKEIKQK